MTEQELRAIRERCDAATKPWRVQENSSGGMTLVRGVEHPLKLRHIQSHLQILPIEDAVFIAATRTDVPALLDEVERLRVMVAHNRCDLCVGDLASPAHRDTL